MAGLRRLLRSIAWSTIIALGTTHCSCQDRVVGDEPMGVGEPACLWLIAPLGFYADGSRSAIKPEWGTGTVCLCLTQGEYDGLGERLSRRGWPEPGTLLEEFNDLAYEECKHLASFEDFVDDECLEYYETGEWLKDIYWSEPPFDNATPPGFTCIDPPEVEPANSTSRGSSMTAPRL